MSQLLCIGQSRAISGHLLIYVSERLYGEPYVDCLVSDDGTAEVGTGFVNHTLAGKSFVVNR